MKKERKRRICNYFMKALLLCALVFGFGFIAGVDVNAGEHMRLEMWYVLLQIRLEWIQDFHCRRKSHICKVRKKILKLSQR